MLATRCVACGADLPVSGVCRVCSADGSGPTIAAMPHSGSDDPTLFAAQAPASGAATVSARSYGAGFQPGGSSELRMAPGTLLAGRYRIVAPIGRGGMGQVYRAEDLKLGETVALKFLPNALAGDPAWLGRFFMEVRTAREVTHPNVCRVHDVVESEGPSGAPLTFLTMEYVSGENLADLVKRFGRLPAEKAMQIAAEIVAALAAAHSRGVLHRDIKPANVMIDGRGQAKLADFGLALGRESAVQAEIAGTPGYIAPELLRGAAATGRSDLYALGLVLYELLTGRRAVKDGKAVTGSIRQYAPEVPAQAETMILRCLEVDPAFRPSGAAEVATAFPAANTLEAALARGDTPSPEMVAESADESPMPLRQAWWLLGGICLVLIATCVASQWGGFLQVAPPVMSPDEMTAEAREILRGQGFATRDVFSATFLNENYAMLDWYSGRSTREQRRHFAEAPQGSIIETFLQSQSESLAPPHLAMSLFLNAPFEMVPTAGVQSVSLDSNGHLLEFEADPVQTTFAASAVPADWSGLLKATGMEAASVRQTSADFVPPFAGTESRSWLASYPNHPEFVFRVNGTAWQGRPVYFEVLDTPWLLPPLPYVRYSVVGLAVGQFAAFAVAILFAVSNLRNRRGDIQAASRLAILVFGLTLLSGVLAIPLSSGSFADLAQSFVSTTAAALLAAALVWTAYIALEPITRKRLPRLLLASSLLLQNRWKSPRIGKELLVGAFAGSLSALSFELLHLTLWPRMHGASLDVLVAQPLSSFQLDLADWFVWFGQGLLAAAEWTVMLMLCLVLVRRLRLAGVLMAAIFIWSTNSRGSVLVAALIASLMFIPLIYTLTRKGVVAALAMYLASTGADSIAWTVHPGSWLMPHMLIDGAIILALAAVAFWLATGRKNPFGSFRLEV